MKFPRGFTLIELIVVMALISILSSTAAVRLLNLQSDAKAAALHGLSGAINSAKGLVFAKAMAEGYYLQKNHDDIKGDILPGKHISLVFGYPAAKINGGIIDAVEASVLNGSSTDESAEWYAFSLSAEYCTGGKAKCIRFVKNSENDRQAIQHNSKPEDMDFKCYVEYVEPSSKTADGIDIIDEPAQIIIPATPENC